MTACEADGQVIGTEIALTFAYRVRPLDGSSNTLDPKCRRGAESRRKIDTVTPKTQEVGVTPSHNPCCVPITMCGESENSLSERADAYPGSALSVNTAEAKRPRRNPKRVLISFNHLHSNRQPRQEQRGRDRVRSPSSGRAHDARGALADLIRCDFHRRT